MITENKEGTFSYEYSVERTKDVEKIVNKYIPKEKDKFTQLKELDRAVENKAALTAIIVGVIGCLIFGAGMCCVLEFSGTIFAIGIVVGIIGMVIMGMALPVYRKKLEKERAIAAPKILELSKEI